MRKKLLTALLLITLSANVVGCGGDGSGKSNSPKHSEEITKIPAETSTPAPVNTDETSVISGSETKEISLTELESYLLNKGVLSGERVQMVADLIGGIDGFKYKDSGCEIYEYDTTSEEYKKLSSGEEIPLKGMESYKVKAVSVNGKFVLFGENLSQELIDSFNSFN